MSPENRSRGKREPDNIEHQIRERVEQNELESIAGSFVIEHPDVRQSVVVKIIRRLRGKKVQPNNNG